MPSNKIKNVLYVGDYGDNYPRNYIFITGLKKQKINVYEVNLAEFNKRQRIKVLLRSFKRFKKKRIDIILFYSIRTSPINFTLSRIFAYIKRIPFVHDIFISKHLTYFYDRKLNIVKRKLKIKLYYWLYYYLLDFFECHLSDYVILDTASHIKYFHEKYNVPIRKFRKVYVGSREDLYFPRIRAEENEDRFIVGYWGTYIPLHGVKYMIKAFKLLENQDKISFWLVGKGQTYRKNRELAEKLNIKNIKFISKTFLKDNPHELPEIISNFDLGLGLYGNSQKTMLAIPNKVFEGMAMKIPMVTCKSPAIRELLTENEHIILCERANPESLAEAILRLKNDESLRSKIKENAFRLYKDCCTIEKIGKLLEKILNNIIGH